MGNAALEGLNLERRQKKREGNKAAASRSSSSNSNKKKTPKTYLELRNSHMEGYTGIPVFYAPQMRRKIPLLKKLVSGVSHESPLFFNYEDLMEAWGKLSSKTKKNSPPPAEPAVEVFNLWDVLTSMEREEWTNKRKSGWWRRPHQRAISSVRARVSPGVAENPDMSSITFVPCSRSTAYKEQISSRGNGKARLRAMR